MIAPVIVIGVLAFYYWDLHARCSEIKNARGAFAEFLQSVDLPGKIRLADYTNFDWDQVRIVSAFSPRQQTVECPFDWNWSSGTREALIADGMLGIMVFMNQGRIVKYVELRADEIAFDAADKDLEPASANFLVSPNASGTGLALSLDDSSGG